MTKAELRKVFLARRRATPQADAARWSAAIQVRALALPELAGREDVYIYVAADGEPETRGIIEALLGQGRRVLAPIVDRSAAQIHWGDVPGLGALRPGAYGIPDPPQITQHAADPHRGIAVVPCVAFTAQGDRLGRGGGYYDRFLATFSGTTVALAYELQRAESISVESHDVRITHVVTEARVYSC